MFENKTRKAVLKKATQEHYSKHISLFVSIKGAPSPLGINENVSIRSGMVYVCAHGLALILLRINMGDDVIIYANSVLVV